jgi:hypothetical protein
MRLLIYPPSSYSWYEHLGENLVERKEVPTMKEVPTKRRNFSLGKSFQGQTPVSHVQIQTDS